MKCMNHKISILFVDGGTPFSKAVMSATQEEFSHVAIQYGDFVIHSNFRGLHVQSTRSFLKKAKIIKQVTIRGDHNRSRLLDLLDKHEFSGYDFGGMLFLGLYLFASKYLKLPLPKSNLWQATGMFMCHEWVYTFLNMENKPMATPGQLYKELLLRFP